MAKIIILHDDDCPQGTNGLRAYAEARDAFASTPPEARATDKDRADLAAAEYELEKAQECNCGAERYAREIKEGKRRHVSVIEHGY